MIRTKLFRRHFAITVIVVLSFVVIGFVVSNLVMKAAMNHRPSGFGGDPAPFFARLIDDAAARTGGDRVSALKHIELMGLREEPFRLHILSQEGKNLSDQEAIPLSWSEIRKPEASYESVVVSGSEEQKRHFPGPPMFPDSLIRLSGSPAQFLYVSKPDLRDWHGPSPALFLIGTIGLLILSLFFGIGFALFLLFRSMQEKMALVDNVIAELQAGNLKVRFPVGRMDELGQAMLRFNRMADEIERLVERLRTVEKSRISLLQDLAHDLRTPIASLKNLLATIEKKRQSDDQEIRAELLLLSRKEVEYFERLVEDLLVLAQMSEPRYQGDQSRISIVEILEEESEGVFARVEADGKSVELQGDLKSEALVMGDAHLLRRLIRNGLENAYSFAKSKVTIKVVDALASSTTKAMTVTVQPAPPPLEQLGVLTTNGLFGVLSSITAPNVGVSGTMRRPRSVAVPIVMSPLLFRRPSAGRHCAGRERSHDGW